MWARGAGQAAGWSLSIRSSSYPQSFFFERNRCRTFQPAACAVRREGEDAPVRGAAHDARVELAVEHADGEFTLIVRTTGVLVLGLGLVAGQLLPLRGQDLCLNEAVCRTC